MAIYNSQLIEKRHRHRGIYDGKEYTVSGVIYLPSGTVLTTDDVFKIAPVGENQVVTQTWAYAVGATGALAVSLGYFQQLDANGDPVVIYRRGPSAYVPSGNNFTSPTSDPDAFAPAAVLSTARKVVDTAVEKLAGPVDFGAAVTTGATLAADVELHFGAVIIGEHNPNQVTGGYPGRNPDYLLGD